MQLTIDRAVSDRDAELLEACRRPGATAAERLVSTFGDSAYRLAIDITGKHRDAEEAVPGAFWSVISGRPWDGGSTESRRTLPKTSVAAPRVTLSESPRTVSRPTDQESVNLHGVLEYRRFPMSSGARSPIYEYWKA